VIRPVPGAVTSPDESEVPVKIFPRKREHSVETDPELRRAFEYASEVPDEPPDGTDDFDDDAFARAIAEGRARDPDAYGGQKIA
jgi:hypothetical protein